MSRFLFVVPPLTGHINPAAAVAAELTARGHEVAWAGRPAIVERLVGERPRVYGCAGPDHLAGRPPQLRGVAALKFLWADFLGPLAEAMAPGVEAAIAAFGPDVVVADQQTVAGALVAERLGVPFATSSTTSAELTESMAGMPGVRSWLTGLLGELRQRIGDPAATHDPRFSPALTLAFTTPELTGPYTTPPTDLRFVGPALAARRSAAGDFPWQWLDLAPGTAAVLITLGTANTDAGGRFLAESVAAVRARTGQLRAVVCDPGGLLGAVPAGPDVLVRAELPQVALLERMAAVVCHAGHNTVTEALWHGVPLVVAPIRDDQPVVAAQVVGAGAGVRVKFARAGREQIGAALDAVVTEPGYRDAARRVRDAFRAAGGESAAAAHLEKLAAEAPVAGRAR
ncbi:glycosyltransferase [Streptomyces sp. TLI_146]|uniref:glycosyltransferase n=1 Tax=Streptomyces sp. TLI_146 TaxID=1938858 RepID=UPI000C705590|nr:glycosyltransferase [Streptomyces sp. TLI_146]PKV88933.1 MGT family glycosyltransferase [Streptomyces sp. TLI_146]